MKAGIRLVSFIHAVFLATVTSANIGENANLPVRAALCGLVEIAGQRATVEEAAAAADPAADHVLEFNMSASDQTWLDIFRSKPGSDDARDYDASAWPKHKDWERQWPAWKQQAAKMLKKDKLDETKKKHNIAELTAAQLQHLRRHLSPLSQEILHLAAAATDGELKQKLMSTKAVQEELNKAVYGKTEEPKDGSMPTEVFEGGPAGNREQNCIADDGSKRAASFLATCVCVCAKDTANQGDASKACTGSALSASWSNANANPSEPLVNELIKLCNRKTETRLTAADLRARLQRVTELITYDGTAAYLGAHINGECNGSANRGICVKYTTLANAGKHPGDVIPWLKELSNLARKLEEHETATLKLKRINEAIQTKAKAAGHLAHMAKQAAKTELDPTTTGQRKPAVAKEDCSNHKDNATCKEKGCKWEENASDKSKGTCKHEGGEGQTNTPTGDGAAGTTSGVNCSKHTKKEDCEKENVGLAQGDKAKCGWIEEKCRDSSFLINKQFALSVVSAAFVALLF
uniref:Variant surface glycoprotein n=1 Tax=Trypanosoma brucei TaxID=5691 RepID=A0A1V0G092_9TRYP|nr:variant surface glycoprotein [Trypanosoma brucei]